MTPPAVLARVLVVGILAFSRGTVTAAAVPAGTINSSVDVEDDDVFVVRSAADAARLARAASRDGAVVDATWVGSVMLDKPIKVGTFTRLTISGSAVVTPADAMGTPPARPERSAAFRTRESGAEEAATVGIASGSAFDLGSNASLVLRNMEVVSDSCDPIFNLRASSRVDAHESSFDFRSGCGDSGDSGSGGDATKVGGSGPAPPQRQMGFGCSVVTSVGMDAPGPGLVVGDRHNNNDGAVVLERREGHRRAGPTALRAAGNVRDARDVEAALVARDVQLAAESIPSKGGHSSTGGASTSSFTLAGGTATSVYCLFFRSDDEGAPSPASLRPGRPGPHGDEEALRIATTQKLAHPKPKPEPRPKMSHSKPKPGSQGGSGGGVRVRSVVEGELFRPSTDILGSSSSFEGSAVLVMHDSFIVVPPATTTTNAGIPTIDVDERHGGDAATPQYLDETRPSATSNAASEQHRPDATTPQFPEETHLSARQQRPDSISSSSSSSSRRVGGGGVAIVSSQEDAAQPSGQGSPLPAAVGGGSVSSWALPSTVGAWWADRDRVSTGRGRPVYIGRRLRGGASSVSVGDIPTPAAVADRDAVSLGGMGWLFGKTASIDSEDLIGGSTDRYAVGQSAQVGPEGEAGAGGVGVGGVSSSRLEIVDAEGHGGPDDCPEGYQGIGCMDCEAEFRVGTDGLCEQVSSHCRIWNAVRSIVSSVVGALFFFFTLDAVRNGKSPTRRVAQIWRTMTRATDQGFRDDVASSDSRARRKETSVRGQGQGQGQGVPGVGAGGDSWGRDGLGRFVQGCIVFIVTAQIVTQGKKVLELELPRALERVLLGLEWTNLDPASVTGTCTLPRTSYFDRVDGAVGLLSACLATLLMSHLSVVLCGCKTEHNKRTLRNKTHANRPANDDSAFNGHGLQKDKSRAKASPVGSPGESDVTAEESTAVRGGWRQRREVSMSSTAAGRRVGMKGGAWERWDRWTSSERHACAAVLVGLLMYPVVCTMLLRVFDCRTIVGVEGSWLRADRAIKCQSDQHQNYRIFSAVFLVLYGVGLPLALLAMVLGARNSKGEGHTSRIHQSDEEQTSSTGRPLGFPLRNSSEAEPSAAAVTSSATVSGEEGGEASGEEGEEEGETSGKTEEAWGDDSDAIGGGGRPRLRAGAEEGGRAKSASVSTIVTNTTVATRRSRNGRLRRAWKTSGRCVVAVRKAMTSRVDPWTVPRVNNVRSQGKQWRSTIPIWSPYRSGRHWFAAWELGRRLVLTGLLVLVPAGNVDEMYMRAVVASALAGVSLAVGELARPHRDPWIRWIYRVGGLMIFVVDLIGLLGQAWSADDQSPSVRALAGIFLVLLPLMIVGVCGGWRLSCAEQYAVTAAAITPRADPSSASSRALPGVGDLHVADQRDDGGNGPKGAGASSRGSPASVDKANLLGRPRNRCGDDLRGKAEADSDRQKARPLSFKQLTSIKSDEGSPSTMGKRSRAVKDLQKRDKPSYTQNPLYNGGPNAALVNESSSEDEERGGSENGWAPEAVPSAADGDGIGPRNKRTRTFDRYMLSRSPRPLGSESPGGRAVGGGFHSGINSDGTITRASIDAHCTPSGKEFYSDLPKIPVNYASLSELTADPTTPTAGDGHTRNRSNSLDGIIRGLETGRRGPAEHVSAAGAGRVPPRTPILAPGAPVIDGHKRRFDNRSRRDRSSSSFASTSFESSNAGDRSRRMERRSAAAARRRSAGSKVYMSYAGGAKKGGGRAGIGGSDSGVPRMPASLSAARAVFARSNSSCVSGSFMSQGSGSVGSWASSTIGPPVLHSLRSYASSHDFELMASTTPEKEPRTVTGNSSNLGSSWVPTRSARGGWPLDLPASSAMPTWWIKCTARGESGATIESDLAAGVPHDLLASAADRTEVAEREAEAALVEAVFGDDNHAGERMFSNAEGGSNIVEFRAFVRAGGSGTSSFDSRASDSRHGFYMDGGGGGGGGDTARRSSLDNARGLDVPPKAPPSMVRALSAQKWAGDNASFKANTPLTSTELRQQFDFDFEDDGDLEEDPVSFVRVSDRVEKINAKMGGLVGAARTSQSALQM